MRNLAWLAVIGAVALSASLLAEKKKKEEQTQTLRLPKDPPSSVTVDPKTLAFHVSPLSAKGLLSAQVHDALKAVTRFEGTIVKIRAFVAGRGDQRRVRDIISSTFTDRRANIPAVTVVQVGSLPLEGAQVVLETTSTAKKGINESGLAFISAQGVSSTNPLDPAAPLADKALASLKKAVAAADSADVLRVTCFLSSLDGAATVRTRFASEYPKTAFNLVQAQRAPVRATAQCEAVARLKTAPAAPLQLINPDGPNPDLSQIALVNTPQVVLTGTQSSFGMQDSDAKLAFERLAKVLEQSGTSMSRVAFASIYPLSTSVMEQVRRVQFGFFDKEHPPARTLIPFEGLPSMDAGFALDVVAAHD